MNKISKTGTLCVDRKYKNDMTRADCLEILLAVFEEILPQYGYAVRAEQISLAEDILTTISRRQVILAEAEVGTGKTLAYLTAAIIAKRGRMNDFWNRFIYPEMSMTAMAHMPVVVATSSIALQKAILNDYIPELSRILMAQGIIKSPITAALRKGREHYLCRRNLEAHIQFEHNINTAKMLNGLLEQNTVVDLSDVDRLTPYVKRRIGVPGLCPDDCPHKNSRACSYLRFRTQVQSPELDVQICNHNYLLADTQRRSSNQNPLIPNYQSLIIDEAHKFLGAARSMYGVEIIGAIFEGIKDCVLGINFERKRPQKKAQEIAKNLYEEGKRLFYALMENALMSGADPEDTNFPISADEDIIWILQCLEDFAQKLLLILESEPITGSGHGLQAHAIWELEQLNTQLAELIDNRLICWLDCSGKHTSFCAIPQDLDRKLHDDLWSKGVPTVLTSGTLSAAGDFHHTRRTLGLDNLGIRLVETSKPSPFDHRENALLYISENMPFPDQDDRGYLDAVAEEVEKLVFASHGHAAVLFTSYKAMDIVWEKLQQRGLPFPLFRMDKARVRALDDFKGSGNGILFAAGAMWEGIDIPGDALSLLIIVKLPFAVPDAISEHERTLYKTEAGYKARVVVPEMLIKLKQGFGRLIRTESDTGVVAILDSRVNKTGAYRSRVLRALPSCEVTGSIDDLEDFIRAKKEPEYFAMQGEPNA